jgi:putative sigma-54 modulation protein
MRYKFVGKNMEVGNRLKARVQKKVKKLEKFFYQDTEAVAVMSIVRNWHVLELTIVQNGITFRAEEKSDDMFISIDKVVDIIERQIRKNKTRLARRLRDFTPWADIDAASAEEAEAAEAAFDDIEESSYVVEEPEYRILRTKKFSVKPVALEEAILQMNLLSHEFFVFMNANTNEVNVVYKRKDESYGIIEPGD